LKFRWHQLAAREFRRSTTLSPPSERMTREPILRSTDREHSYGRDALTVPHPVFSHRPCSYDTEQPSRSGATLSRMPSSIRADGSDPSETEPAPTIASGGTIAVEFQSAYEKPVLPPDLKSQPDNNPHMYFLYVFLSYLIRPVGPIPTTDPSKDQGVPPWCDDSYTLDGSDPATYPLRTPSSPNSGSPLLLDGTRR